MRAAEDDVVQLDEPPGPGRFVAVSGSETTDYVGKILVPDVEQRHGWREFYVMRPEPTPRVALGFRKPGSR